MSTFARTALAAGKPEVVSVDGSIESYEAISRRFSSAPFHHILSQAHALACRAIVIEAIHPSDDIQEENEDILKRYRDAEFTGAWRIAFFSKPPANHIEELTDREFIGYAVMKADSVPSRPDAPQVRVYESVMKPTEPADYIHRPPRWAVTVGAGTVNIAGYLYAQQNDMTNCCAHVAIRTAVSPFLAEGDITYRDINRLLGVNHRSRKIGGERRRRRRKRRDPRGS